MKTFEESLAEYMQDPEFKKEWDALEPEFQIIRAIIEGRDTLVEDAARPRSTAMKAIRELICEKPEPQK